MTEATDTDVTGETAGVVLILTTTTPPPSPPSPSQQDVVLTLPDSSDQIKPQNIEKVIFTLINIARMPQRDFVENLKISHKIP